MKLEWRKTDKKYYLPKTKPEIIRIPRFKFFTVAGEGNPNEEAFGEYIGVLYALSYGVKMSYKKGTQPPGYMEYTVFPLEGIWDLTEAGKKAYNGTLDKDQLAFNLMIRQPDFVDHDFAMFILEETRKKKPHELLDQVKFEEIEEGECCQMLHLGSYDSEPASFELMERFAEESDYRRKSKTHREIYLSDPRRVSPDQLKTVLRFAVEKK